MSIRLLLPGGYSIPFSSLLYSILLSSSSALFELILAYLHSDQHS